MDGIRFLLDGRLVCAENLPRTIEQELRRTSRGNAVRLEVETDCPRDFRELLLEFFDLSQSDVYKLEGPLSMTHLAPLITNDAFASLKDRPFQPARDMRLPFFSALIACPKSISFLSISQPGIIARADGGYCRTQ